MFKRIHSNRDPEKTIWSELNNEFTPYVSKANSSFSSFVNAYPKQIYIGMLILIICSAALSFTLFRVTDNPLQKYSVQQDQVTKRNEPEVNMLNQIDMLQSSLMLRKSIDSILLKKALTRNDSLVLNSAITRLEKIESRLKIKQ